jgi:ribosomal protein L11 methyltransferase
MARLAMSARGLWQISVSVSSQAEDAVVALMERLFPAPVSVYTEEDTKRSLVSVYLETKPDWNARARPALLEGLRKIRACGLSVGTVRIMLKPLRRANWAEVWKAHFRPIAIASGLLVVPSWHRRSHRRNQAVVVIDPGLSFGTGQHPTTLFCLRQILAFRRSDQKQSLLDIGTGSGILAIAAAKLGYAQVRAFDSDVDAVRVARANAIKNRVQGILSVGHQDLAHLPLQGTKRYDLVCANLVWQILLEQSQRITNHLKSTGILVLAGLLQDQFGEVQKRFEAGGLRLVVTATGGEWQSGSFRFAS